MVLTRPEGNNLCFNESMYIYLQTFHQYQQPLGFTAHTPPVLRWTRKDTQWLFFSFGHLLLDAVSVQSLDSPFGVSAFESLLFGSLFFLPVGYMQQQAVLHLVIPCVSIAYSRLCGGGGKNAWDEIFFLLGRRVQFVRSP
jgi:hypothetical protein